MNGDVQLILVSNRGPATFERDEDGELHVQRGGGGLVTALTGLVHHRDALWIASAMTDADVEASRERGGRSFDCDVDGTEYRIRLVESDPDAYENGYRVVNEDLAQAVLDEVGDDEAVVLLHDYHLYCAPRVIRQARPDLFLHHFIHIPWTQPDAWRVLPTDMRDDIYEALLANDIIGFHTRAYRRNFLLCCRELFGLDVDMDAGVVRHDGRETWVRHYPLPISATSFQKTAQRPAVHQYEREVLRRRREH